MLFVLVELCYTLCSPHYTTIVLYRSRRIFYRTGLEFESSASRNFYNINIFIFFYLDLRNIICRSATRLISYNLIDLLFFIFSSQSQASNGKQNDGAWSKVYCNNVCSFIRTARRKYGTLRKILVYNNVLFAFGKYKYENVNNLRSYYIHWFYSAI